MVAIIKALKRNALFCIMGYARIVLLQNTLYFGDMKMVECNFKFKTIVSGTDYCTLKETVYQRNVECDEDDCIYQKILSKR